jgi:hypothetical protein
MKINEDWLAVIIAFVLIALVMAGVFGKMIPISF